MKAGQASRTAEMVAAWRAYAQGRTSTPKYDEPTAEKLLPERARAELADWRAGRLNGFRHAFLETRAQLMVARTVEIDDAIREKHNPQLVILGAGLDGRAWRLRGLEDVTVFEVDHPDTQAAKQQRLSAAKLTPVAQDVRFVPVDFTGDRLGEKLAAAGHDASTPTTWVWEGVVMYLTPAQVEATLAAFAPRSAPGSRLVALYHSRALIVRLLGLYLRFVGEPLRSEYTVDQMRALLAGHGFTVVRDRTLAEVGASLSAELGQRLMRMTSNHLVTADR